MYDFLSHADLGSWAGEGSDTWGWVSDEGREFVAIGQADGTVREAGQILSALECGLIDTGLLRNHQPRQARLSRRQRPQLRGRAARQRLDDLPQQQLMVHQQQQRTHTITQQHAI